MSLGFSPTCARSGSPSASPDCRSRTTSAATTTMLELGPATFTCREICKMFQCGVNSVSSGCRSRATSAATMTMLDLRPATSTSTSGCIWELHRKVTQIGVGQLPVWHVLCRCHHNAGAGACRIRVAKSNWRNCTPLVSPFVSEAGGGARAPCWQPVLHARHLTRTQSGFRSHSAQGCSTAVTEECLKQVKIRGSEIRPRISPVSQCIARPQSADAPRPNSGMYIAAR